MSNEKFSIRTKGSAVPLSSSNNKSPLVSEAVLQRFSRSSRLSQHAQLAERGVMLEAFSALMLVASNSALAISFKIISAHIPLLENSVNNSRSKLVLPTPKNPVTIRSGFFFRKRFF